MKKKSDVDKHKQNRGNLEMENRVIKIVCLIVIISLSIVRLSAETKLNRETYFSVPSFKELPANIEVVSEKTVDGVKVTEMYLANVPFKGNASRIYGFYCRPEKSGKYPGVVEIHGAGYSKSKVSPDPGIQYAKNGFACFVLDWAGASDKRKKMGWRFSEYKSDGTLARPRKIPKEEAKKYKNKAKWESSDTEWNAIRWGILATRRLVMFLKSRPEVDSDNLCVAGMSAGGHMTLLTLGAEPAFKAAAIKYGAGFIRDIPNAFGGYFGPLTLCSRADQDKWLMFLDPKHYLKRYKASVLILTGTDDIFFRLPNVLATYRAIPTKKRLVILPNDNHTQVSNNAIPISWFRSVLGTAPNWPTVDAPKAEVVGDKLKLSVKATSSVPLVDVAFWMKTLPRKSKERFWGLRRNKIMWKKYPAVLNGNIWTATVPVPGSTEQLVAYVMVKDKDGVACSSDTVEFPAYPSWRGCFSYKPWEKTVSVKKINPYLTRLADPAMADKIRKTGTLRAEKNWRKSIKGKVAYDIKVPFSSWYELIVPKGRKCHYQVSAWSRHDGAFTDINNKQFSVVGDRVGSFWLDASQRNFIVIECNNRYGFPDIRKFTIRAVALEQLAKRIRVKLADDRSLLRKDESLKLMVESGALPKAVNFVIKVKEGEQVIAEEKLLLPAKWPAKMETAIDIPMNKAGTFKVEYELDGKPVSSTDIRPININVADTTLVPSLGGTLKRKLLKEIDFVKQEPDYQNGETVVSCSAAGKFRETGTVGWLTHMNGTEPNFFAYKFDVPEIGKLYQVEVDYPDDALRTSVFAVREAPEAKQSKYCYPTAVGADTGGEFSLSNKMLTRSMFINAQSKDLRILVAPPHDNRRAAAAKVRIYQILNELPLLKTPIVGGRHFGNWYEEGGSLKGVYKAPGDTIESMLMIGDRWARTIRHMGGDTLWMTMAIYQFGMYPSNYNVEFNGPHSRDEIRAFLMGCEKYGMNFIGEFHPEGPELKWPVNAAPGNCHRAISHVGGIKKKQSDPLFNPLWPKNQEWYLAMLGEFVDRYKDSPAFKGICLRQMRWCNPGLNNFHNLKWGYDDYTIELFEKETGIKVPVKSDDPKRFKKRYEWLLTNAKEKWTNWRCLKIEQIYRNVVARVQEARSDLKVYSFVSNNFTKNLRDAGLDAKQLQATPGHSFVRGVPYGRENRKYPARELRDKLISPEWLNSLCEENKPSAFLNHALYFEANGKVFPPASLGFPKKTKRRWMSGVVEPAGRHCLERWAIPLAETDTRFLGDGGNAYTVGQPVLRDFLREFRSLPDLPFQAVKAARDPVAVWFRNVTKPDLKDIGVDIAKPDGILKSGFYFYAVNREHYPVTVEIQFKNAKSVKRYTLGKEITLQNGKLKLHLKPYELCAFRSNPKTKLVSVKSEIPEVDRKHVEKLAKFIEKLAEDAKHGKLGVTLDPDQKKLLLNRADEVAKAFVKGHFWRVRTILEQATLQKIYNVCMRFPENISENGNPLVPANAMAGERLKEALVKGKAELKESQKIIPSWTGANLLAASSQKLVFEVDVPLDALYGLEIGRVSGGAYGDIEVSVNGKAVRKLKSSQVKPRGIVSDINKIIHLHSGKATVTIKRESGSLTALQYLLFKPVFCDIVAKNWVTAGPFKIRKKVSVIKAMTTQNWQPLEKCRDFDKEVVLSDGSKAKWQQLSGNADFINLAERNGLYYGTINYAVTHINSPVPTRVRLRYGVDYWIKIWVNGKLVKNLASPGGAAPYKGQFQVDVPLKAGDNEVLVKVAAGSLGNGFWMEVSNPGGLSFHGIPKEGKGN